MEVGGREVAEAKGQRRPGEMVLIDPHTGSGGPVSASWFQLASRLGDWSHAPLPKFFQETILG